MSARSCCLKSTGGLVGHATTPLTARPGYLALERVVDLARLSAATGSKIATFSEFAAAEHARSLLSRTRVLWCVLPESRRRYCNATLRIPRLPRAGVARERIFPLGGKNLDRWLQRTRGDGLVVLSYIMRMAVPSAHKAHATIVKLNGAAFGGWLRYGQASCPSHVERVCVLCAV